MIFTKYSLSVADSETSGVWGTAEGGGLDGANKIKTKDGLNADLNNMTRV